MADVKIKSQHFSLSTAASGTQDFTISGFGTVVGAMFQWNGCVTIGSPITEFLPGFGFTDGTREVNASGFINDDQTTADSSRRLSTLACIDILNNNQNRVGSWSFNSFITDGVRLTIDEQSSIGHDVVVTLFGSDNISNIYCNAFDDLGVLTDAVPITGVGATPDLLFMCSTGGSNNPTTPSNLVHSFQSLGIAINDGSETQRVSLISSENAVTAPASNCTSYIGNDSLVGRAFQDTLSWDAVLTSFDADGFSITPNVSALNGVIMFLAITFTVKPNMALFDMEWPTAGNYVETTPGFLPLYGLISSVTGPSTRNAVSNASYTFSTTIIEDTPAPRLRTLSSSEEDAATNSNVNSFLGSVLNLRKVDGTGNDVVASSWEMTSLGWDFTLTTNPASALLGWALAIGSTIEAQISVPIVAKDIQHNRRVRGR
jgi:hypothetical protein